MLNLTAVSTSGWRYVEVDVANLEKRLSPVFEYLVHFSLADAPKDSGAAQTKAQEEDVRKLLSSAVQGALRAAHGGFLDAHALVLDALFFAWVECMPMVTPCDPFLARGRWRLSTDLFVSLVKDAGLEGDLERKLRNVPEHALQYLAAELSDTVSSDISDGSARDMSGRSLEDGLQQKCDNVADEIFALTAPTYNLRGEAWFLYKQSLSQWERPNTSSSTASELVSALDVARRGKHKFAQSGRLTGSMLLCSSRFHTSRNVVRSEESRHATVERELIAVLNRITGEMCHGIKQDRAVFSSANVDGAFLAAELLNPLLTAPQMTLSRLVHVAAKHSSQAPFLLSAFSALPGLARLQIEPTEPPLMLTVLANVLRNPPSELRGFNQLSGITKFATALFQKRELAEMHDSAVKVERAALCQVNFGQLLAIPRRSHLDPREGLLVTVLPSLLSAFFWQTNGNGRDANELGRSEGDFRALEILNSLLIGHNKESTGLNDSSLSSCGLKLLQATFPGGFLLTLASYIDYRGADRVGVSPSSSGDSWNRASLKATPERTRDLATSLLRSCVKGLREAPPFDTTTADRSSALSVLTSLAFADAAAATQLTWHTRLLLEPVMGEVRKLHTQPQRSPPTAPRFEDRGFVSTEGSGETARLAVAFADLIRLCTTGALRTADVVDQLLREKHNTAADLTEPLGAEYGVYGITLVRNATSPASLRSALLMACAWTLPTCTMKEFGVVLSGFLPKVLSLVTTARSKQSEAAAGGDAPDAVILQLTVVDFLARVLLTCMSDVKACVSGVHSRQVAETVQTLSRQFATAVNVAEHPLQLGNEASSNDVLDAAIAFQNLKYLAAILLRVEALPEGSLRHSKDILLSAALNQIQKVGACMQYEMNILFSRFPETSQSKHIFLSATSRALT